MPWYYYCDIRLYYCDIITTFISDNSTIWQNNSITQKTGNRKYTWLPFLQLPPSGYSIRGTENCQWDSLPWSSLLLSHLILMSYGLNGFWSWYYRSAVAWQKGQDREFGLHPQNILPLLGALICICISEIKMVNIVVILNMTWWNICYEI